MVVFVAILRKTFLTFRKTLAMSLKSLRPLCLILVFALTPDPVEAQESKIIDSLQATLGHVQDTTRVKVLIELCWEYRFSNADTARYFGLQALALAKEHNATALIGEALHTIGITHEAQGDYTKALDYELEALVIREKLGDEVKKAYTLNNLGIIYDEMGDQKKALEHYYRALDIFERNKLKAKIAGTVMNIGIVMKAQKEYAKAIDYYRKSGSLYKELKNELGEGACYANLGSCYLHLPNYDSAYYYSLRGSALFEKLNIRQSLPTTWTNTAIALDTMGRYSEAKRYLLKAKKVQESFGSKKELAFNLIQLSNLYLKTNSTDSALLTIEAAILITEQTHIPEQTMQAYEALSVIKSKRNDYKGAYYAQLQYNVAKDSLFQSQRTKQVLELEKKYQTEKKEMQLAEQRLKLQRNQWLIILLLVILLLMVAIVLVWRRNTAIRQQHLLSEKQQEYQAKLIEAVIALQERERARVAKDLHDGFGQYISSVQLYVSQSTEAWKQNASDLLTQMHKEVRNIAFDLLPHTLASAGLVPALKELTMRINSSNKIRIDLHANEVGRMSSKLEVSLYRICQEWINNILKYNNATVLNINIVQHETELSLIIEDNGNGFDTRVLEEGAGNGWRNMQSRIQLFKGSIFVDSDPKRNGSTLLVEIPMVADLQQVA